MLVGLVRFELTTPCSQSRIFLVSVGESPGIQSTIRENKQVIETQQYLQIVSGSFFQSVRNGQF